MTPPARTTPGDQTSDQLALPVKLFIIAMLLPFGFHLGNLLFTGTRLVVLVLIIPLLFQLFAGKFGKVTLTDVCFTLFVCWMGIAMSVSQPDRMVEHVGSLGPEFLGSYLVGRAYIRTQADFLALCRWSFWPIILMLPLTVIEALTGTPYIIDMIKSIPGISSYASVQPDLRLGLNRVQGPMPNSIQFGLYCSMAIPLAIFVLQNRVSAPLRWTVTMLMFGSAFLGLSAGVMLALVTQFVVIGWYIVMRNVPYKWLILTAIFAVLYVIVDIGSSRTPLRVFLTYATFSPHTGYTRIHIFNWGIKNVFGSAPDNIIGAPWFGIGLGDWSRPFWLGDSVDNFWLLITMRYGVPGFVLLALGYLSAICKIGQRKDFDHDKNMLNIRRAWVIVFFSLTLTLCTVHIWAAIYAYVFFFFGAGMWLLDTHGEQEDKDDPSEATTEPNRLLYSRFPATSRQRTSAQSPVTAPRVRSS